LDFWGEIFLPIFSPTAGELPERFETQRNTNGTANELLTSKWTVTHSFVYGDDVIVDKEVFYFICKETFFRKSGKKHSEKQ
jgi:hypothetical protein